MRAGSSFRRGVSHRGVQSVNRGRTFTVQQRGRFETTAARGVGPPGANRTGCPMHGFAFSGYGYSNGYGYSFPLAMLGTSCAYNASPPSSFGCPLRVTARLLPPPHLPLLSASSDPVGCAFVLFRSPLHFSRFRIGPKGFVIQVAFARVD